MQLPVFWGKAFKIKGDALLSHGPGLIRAMSAMLRALSPRGRHGHQPLQRWHLRVLCFFGNGSHGHDTQQVLTLVL